VNTSIASDTSVQHSVAADLHRGAYFTLQALRGRPVARYMRQLRQWERLSRSELERITQGLLGDALQYASESVPLYRSTKWSESLRRCDPRDIEAWPVLERQLLREHPAELLSSRKPLASFYRRSSASTGAPVRVAWNPHGAAIGWANEHQAMLWHGVPPGVDTLLFWGYGNQALNWVRNYRVFRTTQLTPDLLEEATRYALRTRPVLCVGLPSAIAEWARYVHANHRELRIHVPFMKLGGEQIYPFQREELEQYFGSRVVETYGCTEMGPIAAECTAGSMHILSTHVHVEIFRDGSPAAPGEFGDIVATSLSNRAMPLVRCKIGDSGRISPDPCSCGLPYPVLEDLVGRVNDMLLAADGSRVHGSALGAGLRTVLASVPLGAIRQVLFQQVDQQHWRVLVESDSGFAEETTAKLVELVRATCGKVCHVEVERVNLVPREASGKFRYYRPAGPQRSVPPERGEMPLAEPA
jgi:phenylacetate-coenzyme A ligase PaaK-like adenylate-forming protein